MLRQSRALIAPLVLAAGTFEGERFEVEFDNLGAWDLGEKRRGKGVHDG